MKKCPVELHEIYFLFLNICIFSKEHALLEKKMISEGKHKRKTTESNTETKQKCRDPHFDRLCTTYFLKMITRVKHVVGVINLGKKILSIP